jgi:D-3-phosphoglycerate dehydrogenase / 2-oxoglutarate reductase
VSKRPVVLCVEMLPVAMRELMAGQKPEGLDLVFVDTSEEEEKVAKVREADYILCSWSPLSGRVIEAAPKLKLVQKYGIGVEKIDLATAARRGVPVCIAAGANAVGVAEAAITLMLAVYRCLCVAHNSLRAGQWLKWELRTGCYELWQKTVGLIGGGNIGRAVAKRLSHGFECRVLYYDIFRLPPEAEAVHGMTYAPREELLRQADIVSLHVPLTSETRGMMNPKAFALMKPTAVLINTARGGVVDEPALIDALQKKKIAGAGLDVFAKEPPDRDNPLLRMDHVVVMPHNSGGTVDTMKRTIGHAFENILRFERGEALPEADRVKT